MTEQNQQPSNVPNFSAKELSIKWADLLDQVIQTNLLLEKQILAQVELIQNLTANEVGLVDRIQDLEEALKKCRDVISPTAAQMATDGRVIIQENRKAAPEDGLDTS